MLVLYNIVKGGDTMKTVLETAEMFSVTRSAVYLWLRDGLKHESEKVIGRKTRIIIDPQDVIEYHKSKEVTSDEQ